MSDNQLTDDENALKEKMIMAEFDYYSKIRVSWSKKFLEETNKKVMDETHYLFKYLHFTPSTSPPDIQPINPEEETLLKKYYHELSLLTHPDKCTESWAGDMFVLVDKYYKEHKYQILKNMIDYYQKHTTFANFIPPDETESGSVSGSESGSNLVKKMEKDISRWKSEIWYLYFTEKVYREFYISKEELEIKKQALAEEKIRFEKIQSDFDLSLENFKKNLNKNEQNKV
jgi:hypothetical protein